MSDFVSFDLAKKLKEKGFREKCLHHYNNNDILTENYSKCYCSANNIFTDNTVDAPTIYQVLKWLREEKNLFVDITLCCAGYRGCILSTIIPEGRDSPKGWTFAGSYKTYELAAIEGIKCVLDNFFDYDR